MNALQINENKLKIAFIEHQKMLIEITGNLYTRHLKLTLQIMNIPYLKIEHFDTKFAALQDVWENRERPYCGSVGLKFYDHLSRYHAEVVRSHMQKDLRS